MKLLQEMIDAFSGDSSNSNADRELMKELFEECERLRPNLFKVSPKRLFIVPPLGGEIIEN